MNASDSRRGRMILIAGLAFVALSSAHAQPDGSDLAEQVKVRLVQIDMSLSGDPAQIRSLTMEDFDLVVGGRRIREFEFDLLCGPAESEPQLRDDDDASPAEAPPATYMWFFDQAQLTTEGRRRSLELARQFARSLLRPGDRVMVTSNSHREMVILTDFTSDPDEILAALDFLEDDAEQVDSAATLEDVRVAELNYALREERQKGPLISGISLARLQAMADGFRWQETIRTDRSLRRFQQALARLTSTDAPRMVLYFGDTLRANAGQHYLRTVTGSVEGRQIQAASRTSRGDSRSIGSTAFVEGRFEQLINEASTLGIRIYSVEAQGLVDSSMRVADAQSALRSMGLETGGDAFLNGVIGERITGSIRQDLACFSFLSFVPRDLPKDTPLAVRLSVLKDDVKTRSRGRLVVPSEKALLAMEFRAVDVNTIALEQYVDIHASLIPLGYADGEFRVLVQAGAGSPNGYDGERTLLLDVLVQGDSWEPGATTLDLGPSMPRVVQSDLVVLPGPFEVVVAIRDEGQIRTAAYLDTIWPDPTRGPVTALSPVILQPGHFRLADGVTTSGPLALAESEAASIDQPLAMVTLICGDGKKRTLRVERQLMGGSAVDFEPAELQLGKAECAQMRDVVSAGALGPGRFRYTVRVVDKNGNDITRAQREFETISTAN